MTRTSTPSERTRCAMSSSPTRTIGCSPPSLHDVALSAFTWRCVSPSETAAASRGCLDPVRRPLTCTTTRQTPSSPPKVRRSGWRLRIWKWTPLRRTRASRRWILVVDWWKWTRRCGASVRCRKTAFIWHFRTTAHACPCCLSVCFIRNALVSCRTLQSFQRPWPGQRAPRWWSLAGYAFRILRKWTYRLSCTAMAMGTGWFRLGAAPARQDSSRTAETSVEVRC